MIPLIIYGLLEDRVLQVILTGMIYMTMLKEKQTPIDEALKRGGVTDHT